MTGLLGDTSGPSMGGEAGNVYGAGFQPAWFDYDEDGDLDLYVVNDLGREIHPNVLWRNDGPRRRRLEVRGRLDCHGRRRQDGRHGDRGRGLRP